MTQGPPPSSKPPPHAYPPPPSAPPPQKQKRKTKWWVWAIGILLLIGFIGSLTEGEESSPTGSTSSSSDTESSDDDASEEPEEPADPADELEADVRDALGSSNRDVERIATFEAERGGEVHIKWAIDDNLTEGLVKDSARLDVRDILAAVKGTEFRYRTVFLEGTFVLVDKFGEESEDVVVRAVYPRRVVEKINYQNIDFKSILDLAGSSFVHPAFQY